MFKYRDYQERIIESGVAKLSVFRIVMLAMEVRTGKTLTALGIANKMKFNAVLFVTTKKVIESGTILNDYNLCGAKFELDLINYESLHKINPKKYNLIIVDESHKIGAFPKPSVRTKKLKVICTGKFVLLLTGTPTPESWSQLYHQFWISDRSPFGQRSFYEWARSGYVNVFTREFAHGKVNDYSRGNEKLIRDRLANHIISYSQAQSGFKSKVKETVLSVKMKPTTYKLAKTLERDLVYKGANGGVILGDTPVKLMQKVHQIYSGTIKLEDGSSKIIDDSKAQFIKEFFSEKKIAIFYKFKEELQLLKNVFGWMLTTDLNEFNNTNTKNIALQIVAGREGISLKKADALVMYNIDFSAVSYWQARDRMTTKDRAENLVYWIFSVGGLEEKIYKQVLNKKSFTTKHYDRSKLSKEAHQTV